MNRDLPPDSALHPDLPELPETMRKLPVFRGYPVPWFVHWNGAEPEFRIMDWPKLQRAVRERLCWVCGQPFTNRRRAFVLGPMCAVNRISAEPPCHLSCARFSARACPFLSKPQMIRRENDLPAEIHVQPGHLDHNPTVALVWLTKSFSALYPVEGSVLFDTGEPIDWEWYREGRPATRAEVMAGLDVGLPKLREQAAQDGDYDVEERIAWVEERIAWVLRYMLPRENAT